MLKMETGFGLSCAIALVAAMGNMALADSMVVDGRTWTYSLEEDRDGYSRTICIEGVSPAVGAIAIPSYIGVRRVTSIDYGAFAECTEMTSVSIPASVTFIDDCAFEYCSALKTINVASANAVYKSVNGLLLSKDGHVLYEGVNGQVRIPDGVEMIADDAFSGRRGLASVYIPASVTELGEAVFTDCSSLKTIAVDPANEHYRAEKGLLLSRDGRTLLAGVNGDGAVRIPDGVERFVADVFNGRTNLTSVTIPASVTEVIGEYGMFAGCSSLKSINVAPSNSIFRSVDGLLLLKDEDTLLAGVNGDVRIPDGVREIAESAFRGRENLTSVSIPGSVGGIGESAFANCGALTTVTMPTNMTIGARAFEGCRSLTTVDIPMGVKYVYARTFADCRSLVTVTIPASVRRIEDHAFADCRSLRTVIIPASVTEIGQGMFKGCDALRAILVDTNNQVYKSEGGFLLSKDGGTLWEGVNGDVCIPDGVREIAESAFHGRGNLTSVRIPAGVTYIAGGEELAETGAFKYCGSLKAIVVDSGNECYKSENGLLLSKDGRTLLAGVNGQVRIPDGVEEIMRYAFYGLKNLTSVTIPASMRRVARHAFAGCDSLTSAMFMENAPECGWYRWLEWEDEDNDGWYGREEEWNDALPAACTVYVHHGTTGWLAASPGIPGTWYGRRIEYVTSDSADPKDDVAKGAVNWALKSTRTSFERTLWADDPEDNFKITGKDGLLYDIAIEDATCDAVFSITNANGQTVVSNATSASRIALPKTKAPYYLTVRHGTDAKIAGSYVVAGLCADVGSIKLAKTALSVKESAAYAEITVNRMGKDGLVRVRYATADGTAKAGEDYVETSGVLEWTGGDKKAKKVRIPLIPDLVAYYDGTKSFTVAFAPMTAEEMAEGEYPAIIAGGDVCTVTVTETSKTGTTVASVYAKQAPKRATVKTENVPLSSGTFYGVVAEDGDALTNGLPKLASITFTASAAATPALSAKVAIGGKTYSFSAKGWDETADGEARDQALRTRTLVNVQKSGKAAYTNVLTVAVRDGRTTEWDAAGGALDKADGWGGLADATVELTMNVPDAKGKGFQTGVRYAGALWRQNAKIQAYLDAVTNFAGYYTMSLVAVDAAVAGGAQDKTDGGTDAQSAGRDVPVAPNSGESAGDGAAIGNGYLTLTVDNKGGVKVAGMLADGATKPSVSPKACAIVADESSVTGYALLVPVHFAKGTVCFGGTLRLRAVNEVTPDGSGRRVVVDSSAPLAWYDDSATGCIAMNCDGEGMLSLAPCGGWYDKVINLQRNYLDYALSVETADISEFPTDELPAGYGYVAGVSPDGFALALENDKVVYDKRKIVKTNKLTDFSQSTNACNVSVKLARATGLVTGGFSLWSATEDGAKQKEITGFKTYGVLLLARDPSAPLDERVIAPGFATKKVKTTYVDEKGKKKTVTWPFSAPFGIKWLSD